jgi:hypothetical protein
MAVGQQIHLYKTMKKFLIIFILGFTFGTMVYLFVFPPFNLLPLDKMPSKIDDYLHLAIEKAEKAGVYNCCVEPACTMCFLEGNLWNNQKSGRCNCADFVRQGKEPCPQCNKILSRNSNTD